MVEQMALDGKSDAEIFASLVRQGLMARDAAAEHQEVVELATRVRAARAMVSARPGRGLPRTIGFVAVCLGILAIVIQASEPGLAPRGYRPASYGIVALVLGLILLIKPSAGRSEL